MYKLRILEQNTWVFFKYFYIGWEFEGKSVFSGSQWLCAEQRCLVAIKRKNYNSSKLASFHSSFFLRMCLYARGRTGALASLLLLGLVIYSVLPGDMMLLSFQIKSIFRRLKPAPIYIQTLLLILEDKF